MNPPYLTAFATAGGGGGCPLLGASVSAFRILGVVLLGIALICLIRAAYLAILAHGDREMMGYSWRLALQGVLLLAAALLAGSLPALLNSFGATANLAVRCGIL